MSSEIHALSGAYAVDAVNDLERAEFERHLAECSDCRAEVASLREATVTLAHQASAPAPESLRGSVLAEIAKVRPLPPVTTRTVPQEGGARRWFPALVAAAVLTVVGIGGAVWQPWNPSDETTQSQLTASERVLQDPDAERISLDFADGANATVTRSKAEGRAVITTSDMAPAPDGKVYELWLQQEDGTMVAAGLMPTKADQTVLLEGDADAAVGAGITIEPAGGSPEPTSDPIALFEFAETT